jgi:hypothetical protein
VDEIGLYGGDENAQKAAGHGIALSPMLTFFQLTNQQI